MDLGTQLPECYSTMNDIVFPGLIMVSSLMQLQDAGCWTDAATLAATHLKGSDYARSFIFFHQ